MKVKKIRAKSQEKRKGRVKISEGEKNKQPKMNNGLYLQLLLWFSSTKQDLAVFLQLPVVSIMIIITIRLPPTVYIIIVQTI